MHPVLRARASVEQFVSEHVGRRWTIVQARDLEDLACHPAMLLSDGAYEVFAKFSEAAQSASRRSPGEAAQSASGRSPGESANGREQFEIELTGLRLLHERAGVLVPTPIGIVEVEGGHILVLEGVQAVPRETRQWRDIGQALARIHRVHGERFGLETSGFFGPLPQDNTPSEDWASFYVERRLWPNLRLAVSSGNLPVDVARRVERLIARFPELCGPAPQPTLLHGDAQQNNWISTAAGPVAIDPSVYYGHPELDLASLGLWQPVPDNVLQAYGEELPIDPGFAGRRDLWRVCAYLAAVSVEGPAHLGRLAGAMDKYL